MSRSLAIVGILAILGGAETRSAMGQTDGAQTSQGLVVKNHMSDAERDRLMKEAMAKARAQLERQKSDENAAMDKAAAKDKATDTDQKARDEALARQLADEEKARAADSAPDMELEPLKPAETAKQNLDQEPKVTETEKKIETKKAESPKVAESKKSEETKKTVAETKKSDSSATKEEKKETASAKSSEKSSARSDDKPTDLDKAEEIEQAVIETVSTNQPGEGISVKTSMPRGDEARRAEQQAALSRGGDFGSAPRPDSDRSGGSSTISGRVVGMMRASNDMPRILVQSEDRGMVQVVIENGSEMPAPGSYVSIKGRDIGGSGSRRVVSAQSVTVKSGTSAKAPAAVAAVPAPMGPIPGLPHPPPIGFGPPMPMGGPLPMMPPPPPF